MDAKILHSLLQSGVVPVVATVATDETGQALNINADTAAAEIAAALSAEKLILMTGERAQGVLRAERSQDSGGSAKTEATTWLVSGLSPSLSVRLHQLFTRSLSLRLRSHRRDGRPEGQGRSLHAHS